MKKSLLKTFGFGTRWVFMLGIALLSVPNSCLAAELSTERPNILFCMADDWGWPHAGVYGDKVVRTPVFDSLAKDGVLFKNAFVSSPSCTPCRSSIITGQQFYRLGRGANLAGPLDVKHPNFMYLLRDSGYEIGHWRKAWLPGDFRQGGYTKHPCGPESTFTEFMKNRGKNSPFCFWFGTHDPHRKYSPKSGVKSGLDLSKIHVPGFFPDTEAVRSDIADYYFEVERWDSDVGKALELLRESGELDNTIVVMTGDHGMPFPRCKGNMYDWGVRVPLVVHWPGTKPGRTLDEFVSLPDLAPTFLKAAGVEAPKVMTGRSLFPLLKGEAQGEKNRDHIIFGRERHTRAQGAGSLNGYPSRAIRTDKWLFVMNLKPERLPAGETGKFRDCDRGPTKSEVMALPDSRFYELCFAARPGIELYDCENDPEQITNLADDPKHTDTIDDLRGTLEAYLHRTGDPRFTDEEPLFDSYP